MGISIWQLAIVLVIVLLLFGTKKLRNLGSDLGSAVKGFKSAVKDGSAAEPSSTPAEQLEQHEGAAPDTDVGSASGADASAAAGVSSKEGERA